MAAWARLSTVAFRFVYAAVLIAVAWFIGTHIQELKAYDYELRPAYLAIALVTVIAAYLVNIQLWRATSRASGVAASWLADSKAWIVSRLGRYIPGKIPVVLLRLTSYSTGSRRQAGSAMVVEAASTLFASSVFVLLIVVSDPRVLPGAAQLVLLGIGVLAAFLSFSRLVPSFGSWLWRRLGKESVDWSYPAPMLVLKLSLGQVLVMLLHGTALFLVLNSVSVVSGEYLLLITGIYYLAGLLGLVAVFAPSGLGVREGVLLALLPLVADMPTVVVATILIRLISTVGEALLATILLFAGRYENPEC